MRAGLAMVLERSADLSLCGEAGTPGEARELVISKIPALLVLDLVMGGRDGIPLLTELLALQPTLRILVYTSLKEDSYARRALRAGAWGYLMKTENLESVSIALHAMAKGERVMSATVRDSLVSEALGGSRPPLERLSERELQVLRLLGQGLQLGEIARELQLSVKTVGSYRERLKDKIGVDTARELARRAGEFLEAI